ncbi:2-keto-4-pentenoate hydratase/2-oxohepta-3-ene-1,7-dioic acid hydratase in catechol pathway [Rhizobium binae]|uniref:2-keto-4-pentenoate hydratase/2-oxohepta-3-ene-1,7-dioic acid hydratase in catechol pathway n=1 Tax=Rhizobium binae TaxID=1138190 RepID=A0ABV2MMJ2_9HYPH|nr:fumarylacetoacetate hydrolase family protein [Rhizobium binae]NKL50345.1 5-carboxymethyl-2-hydroxymuconate isomerase [Rhizobium leguminosarum bv. viciae]MBX4926431.1 fumarylacetoacetate hydrolase family protein [Rhizobium binae]MBX4949890.1 fumarylacetoacetate hydrolase family protein [Rhizobium binae]MBX4994567.1 fumarylacetoacetate hydrolase family protein [Rhizobium binae]QSY84800.1 fumarylacetoacetate hydrolase family protein [Rhizobium binae]
MKLSTVKIAGRVTWGIVEGETFHDVGAAMKATYPDLKQAVAAGFAGVAEAKAGAATHLTSEVEWLAVIPNPDKILCVGLNYEMHRQETGRSVVENPTIFARYANSQTGHLTPIIRPKVSSDLDYEGELAVIISKPGRYISRENALEHVAGYSIYNDGSVRDFQRHTHQFTPGKNFPDTGAFGPWMMTPDELGDLDPLRIQTRLNGEIVQDATFGMMIFDVARIIEYCSSFTRLEAGDVIATGTPGGVGAKRNPPLWMKPGDIVEVEIDKLGILTNPIGQEA